MFVFSRGNRVGGGLVIAGDLSKMFRAPENSSLWARWVLKGGAVSRYIVA